MPSSAASLRIPTPISAVSQSEDVPSDVQYTELISGQACGGRRVGVLRAMAKQVVGQNAGHHRLAYRNGADAHAGIVAAFGRDLDILAEPVDRVPR